MNEPTTPAGIDGPAITAWLSARAPVTEPLTFSLISGGRSNLTFDVTDAAGGHWVLRRPPIGHVLATAHDMGREHRIIAALRDTAVPVPPAIDLCTDAEVNDAPFFVMDYVDGLVLRDRATAEQLDLDARGAAGMHLIDVLAAIHAVDPDEVGLGDLGRREHYVERQLKRWHSQWERSAYTHVTGIDDVHGRLSAKVPEQRESTIVHGDYRLDNCIVTPDGQIAAVLDWELCTLGDPLADIGLLLVYWSERSDGFSAMPDSPTTVAGFPDRDQITARYAEASGREIGDVDYFVALGYWKLACILAGVATRYADGQMGDDADAAALAELFGAQIENLVVAASGAAERSGR
ncbi:MAG TPA: phosphotransferase family protein [Acidimicrobiales bacterium]|nr:phosphotransferase family protein [Acidimicrobiales bacterium]